MANDNDEVDPRPIRRTLRRLIKAPAAWSLIWPMALLVGSYLAYSKWYADYLALEYQRLTPEAVMITQPHEYIRYDLIEEVFDDTSLAELSPLDRHATVKLATAFSSSPWVKQVRGVRKLPGGKVDIDVDYREPVAAFHLTGDDKWLRSIEDYLTKLGHSVADGADQLYFPLDGEGYILPTRGMTLPDTEKLIHIEVSEVYPTGNKGTPFGDRRVESAALLAKLLMAVRDQVQVAKILVSGDPRSNLVPKLELVLGDGTELHWGSPPGMEQPRERDARAKLTDLLSGNYVSGSNLSIARRNASPIR